MEEGVGLLPDISRGEASGSYISERDHRLGFPCVYDPWKTLPRSDSDIREYGLVVRRGNFGRAVVLLEADVLLERRGALHKDAVTPRGASFRLIFVRFFRGYLEGGLEINGRLLES